MFAAPFLFFFALLCVLRGEPSHRHSIRPTQLFQMVFQQPQLFGIGILRPKPILRFHHSAPKIHTAHDRYLAVIALARHRSWQHVHVLEGPESAGAILLRSRMVTGARNSWPPAHDAGSFNLFLWLPGRALSQRLKPPLAAPARGAPRPPS